MRMEGLLVLYRMYVVEGAALFGYPAGARLALKNNYFLLASS